MPVLPEGPGHAQRSAGQVSLSVLPQEAAPYARLLCSKDHLLFQMKPVGQKNEPFGARERRPVTCPSRVGQNWGGGESLAELGREIGPRRSGFFCGKGSSLTET